MSRDSLRSWAIALTAVILMASLFFTCFERRSVELPVGWSREALGNPYLAAQRLLERMGHEVVRLDGPAQLVNLPPTDGTLVIPRERSSLGPRRSAQILDWVERGGHLVVVTYSLWDESPRQPDPLLDRFGLRQYRHELEEQEEEEGEGAGEEEGPDTGEEATEGVDLAEAIAAAAIGVPAEPAEWDLCEARWPELEDPLVVQFDWRFYWVDIWEHPSWHVSGDWGAHLVMLEHGNGWITALTDEFFMRNDHIGDADHAEFLVRLARVGQRTGPVWFVVGEHWPGLWSQAREHATPAVVSLGVLVLVWMWRASRRFGPLLPEPPPERRRWIEHLEAVGRYHWREDRGRSLLAGARSRAKRARESQHPGWARLSPRDRAQPLAERTGLSPQEVARAFDEDFHPATEAAFVSTVAQLERIRASL